MPVQQETKLRAIVAELYGEARRVASMAAAGVNGHPCAPLARTQFDRLRLPLEAWQLPEPFNGEPGRAMVAFVGLNPSIDPEEDVPRWSSPLDDYLEYYVNRLERHRDHEGRIISRTPAGRTWRIRLYNSYENLLRQAFGPDARLGRDAVVLELVPYKGARRDLAHIGREAFARIARHALPRTLALIDCFATPVVVTVGADATRWVLGQAVTERFRDRRPKQRELHGNAVTDVVLPHLTRPVTVIPSLHLSGAYAVSAADRDRLAGAMRDAVSRCLR